MAATLAPAGAAAPAPGAATGVARRVRPADALLVGTVVLGAALRWWALGASHLSYDESFTAMAGRLPLGEMVGFLTRHDSHPPLDYLLHAPLARMGLAPGWIRLPGAVCSAAAVALVAWWLRARGVVALLATVLLAVGPFAIEHGRLARGYAELELLGVGVAMLTAAWLERPRRCHAALLGGLVLVGLLTHVSMFLVAFGLLVVPGRRRDREAWRWRGAVLAAVAVWAGTWGPHFLVQARGGHSSWIPPTSLDTLRTAVAHLVTPDAAWSWAAIVAIVVGGAELVRRDRTLGRVWVALFVVPVALGALLGRVEPVVLDRTFTLMLWAPVLAVAVALDSLGTRWPVLGRAVTGVVVVMLAVGGFHVATTRIAPDGPLAALDARARPGDVVAVRPAFKAPETQWSLGVRRGDPLHRIALRGWVDTYAVRLGGARASGRVWVLDWHARRAGHLLSVAAADCAPRWTRRSTAIRCLPAGAVPVPTVTGTV